MRIVTLPNGFLVLLTGLLAACGSGVAAGASGPGSAAPRALSVASSASSAPSPLVTATASSTEGPNPAPTLAPLPPPPPVAAPVPAAPMLMAHATSATFALRAVGDPGAGGSVAVTMQSGRAVITVLAMGIPAGSVHSVHLHFGNCPSAGSHILVLGTLRADASGSGSVTASVNAIFTGPGHFVIVYLGPSAGTLGACANLG